ncbi:MAG: hypothetical protein J6S53_00100 [Lentisphaeria bacterium]|nr:hypothetical protein [Lentisphaeria bacterium]
MIGWASTDISTTDPVLLLGKGARQRRYLLKYGRNREYIQDELARIQAAEKIFSAFDEVYSWAKKEIVSIDGKKNHDHKNFRLLPLNGKKK